MMNLFCAVKEAVPVAEAARYYGLDVPVSGMLRCPFHDDRHPSLKLYDDHFYCFGCQKHGDVIDFTAELLGLPLYEAACALAEAFGVSVISSAARNPSSPAAQTGERISPLASLGRNDRRGKTEVQQFRENQEFCQRVLSKYLRLLRAWREEFAPGDPNAAPDDRFVEACQMLDRVEALLDLLIAGSLEQRVQLVDRLLSDGKIDRLEERLHRLETT